MAFVDNTDITKKRPFPGLYYYLKPFAKFERTWSFSRKILITITNTKDQFYLFVCLLPRGKPQVRKR